MHFKVGNTSVAHSIHYGSICLGLRVQQVHYSIDITLNPSYPNPNPSPYIDHAGALTDINETDLVLK